MVIWAEGKIDVPRRHSIRTLNRNLLAANHLIGGWLQPAQRTVAGLKDQFAGCCDAYVVRSSDLHLDRRGVRARSNVEVILEVPLLPVEDEIHAGIHG